MLSILKGNCIRRQLRPRAAQCVPQPQIFFRGVKGSRFGLLCGPNYKEDGLNHPLHGQPRSGVLWVLRGKIPCSRIANCSAVASVWYKTHAYYIAFIFTLTYCQLFSSSIVLVPDTCKLYCLHLHTHTHTHTQWCGMALCSYTFLRKYFECRRVCILPEVCRDICRDRNCKTCM